MGLLSLVFEKIIAGLEATNRGLESVEKASSKMEKKARELNAANEKWANQEMAESKKKLAELHASIEKAKNSETES